jgi:ABC-type sugar transport system ATPase subunit
MMSSIKMPEICTICQRVWVLHSQEEQDACFRAKTKHEKGGSGIW